MVKWVSAFGLSNNNKWRWWIRFTGCLHRRACGSSQLTLSKGWQPPGAVSVFIAWTEWTLEVALLWWQHYKYHCIIIVIIINGVNAATTFNFLIAHQSSKAKLYHENVVQWLSLLTFYLTFVIIPCLTVVCLLFYQTYMMMHAYHLSYS